MTKAALERTASFSDDGLYRYDLARRWDDGPLVLWVMLNPSTADDSLEDPTLTRCINYSRAWGNGGCALVNLYAFRSPDPKALTSIVDPVGPENERYLRSWLSKPPDEVRTVVTGWGAKIPPHRPHPPVILIADEYMRTLFCLGRTKGGRPRHPLYLKETERLEVFHRPPALQERTA